MTNQPPGCQEAAEFSPTAMDHALNPRNLGPLGRFQGYARITGPCGDTMEFWVELKRGRVARAGFLTDGCGPSLASGSMATVLALGRSPGQVSALGQDDILEALGGLPPQHRHCALLAANPLKKACEEL
jgi:nitrogen fixation NifU-like protein